MAGMPGMFVASVFSGAHVITVTVPSPALSADPGTRPQPATRAAPRATAAMRKVLLLLVWRRPVMDLHDSPASRIAE
ncbi:hypothetical protein GCM10010431_07930 [Streptomyces kunmingensis]